MFGLQVTGREVPHIKYYGKPNPAPYRLMEGLLLQQAGLLGLLDDSSASAAEAAPDELPEALDAEQPAQPLPFSSVSQSLRPTCSCLCVAGRNRMRPLVLPRLL